MRALTKGRECDGYLAQFHWLTLSAHNEAMRAILHYDAHHTHDFGRNCCERDLASKLL